jgi:hypothetical protein
MSTHKVCKPLIYTEAGQVTPHQAVRLRQAFKQDIERVDLGLYWGVTGTHAINSPNYLLFSKHYSRSPGSLTT